MDTLSSAAAQGEQAYEPHHADGYNFTGADPSVRTLEDAVRHDQRLGLWRHLQQRHEDCSRHDDCSHSRTDEALWWQPTRDKFVTSDVTRQKKVKKHAKEDSYLECFCGSVHGAPLYARIR